VTVGDNWMLSMICRRAMALQDESTSTAGFTSISSNCDGSDLVSGSFEGGVSVWDLEAGKHKLSFTVGVWAVSGR